MSEEKFLKYLSQKGLKLTDQRRLVFRTLLEKGGHISSEELYDHVKAADRSVGQATVYRTLKLLTEAGLANEISFGDGVIRYEPAHGDDHHDHLICTQCGLQVEFYDPAIEDLQSKQARRHGFTLQSHKLLLYGVCPDCR